MNPPLDFELRASMCVCVCVSLDDNALLPPKKTRLTSCVVFESLVCEREKVRQLPLVEPPRCPIKLGHPIYLPKEADYIPIKSNFIKNKSD